MLQRLRQRYWDAIVKILPGAPEPALPRLYEQYGRAALAAAAEDPVLAEKITRKVERFLQTLNHRGRPYRGVMLYAFLNGVATGAVQVMLSDAGTGTFDDDGAHLPTIAIAACCQVAIDKGMLEAA